MDSAPRTGKVVGMPIQPATTAKTASTISGMVIQAKMLSCSLACSAASVRGLPKKVIMIWRPV